MLPDIGAMELFLVAVVALIVVGPKELPRLLKTISGFVRQARAMADEFRRGVDTLAREVADEADPFKDLKDEEGIRPGMSAEQITEQIMRNRGVSMDEAGYSDEAKADADAESETVNTIARDDRSADTRAPESDAPQAGDQDAAQKEGGA